MKMEGAVWEGAVAEYGCAILLWEGLVVVPAVPISKSISNHKQGIANYKERVTAKEQAKVLNSKVSLCSLFQEYLSAVESA